MASFHLSPKSFSRARGQSAIAASAYRSGQELCDDRTGQVHDYSRKTGVLQTEIMLPDAAPEWAQDLEKLWNEAEAAERRKDAKVAREFEISLPYELPYGQRLELAREFAQEVIDRYGVAAQVSLHAPGKEGDQRNWHAHILTTTRTLEEDGFGDKVRVLDSPKTSGEQIVELREKWADMQNRALAEAGLDVRVDHRTLAEQGIGREPQIHLGPHATAMERRGIETERGELNREIIAANQALAEINQTLAKVQEQQNERARIEHSFAEHGEALNGKLCDELEGYRKRLAEANKSHIREFSSAVENAEFRDGQGLIRAIKTVNCAYGKIDISLQLLSEDLGRVREIGEAVRKHRELESIAGDVVALEFPDKGINSDLKQASERLAEASRGIEKISQARAQAAELTKMEQARQAMIAKRLQMMQLQKPEAQVRPDLEMKRQAPQKSPELPQEGPKVQAPIPEVKKPDVAQQRPQEVTQAPIVANAVPARLKETVASKKERLVDALQPLLAADAAYKKSFHAPREKVAQAIKQAQEHKTKQLGQAVTVALEHVLGHGLAATLSLVREQLGENFDLIRAFEREFEMRLGRDRGLSR